MSRFDQFKKRYLQLDASIEHIEEQYISWVNDDKFMILENRETKKCYASLLSKRGNPVYRSRVRKRFNILPSNLDDVVFFDHKSRDIRDKATRALFFTLTFDIKLLSWEEAWKIIGEDFNRFRANITKRYGKVSVVRIFESSAKGYPHVHCVILFRDREFRVFRDRRGKHRIAEKGVFAGFWHSNVDVQAIYSLRGGLRYIGKYLLKGIDADHMDLKTRRTLALCWAFGKRTFSVSGDFREVLLRLRKVKAEAVTGDRESDWVVLGFVAGGVLGLCRDRWFVELDLKQVRDLLLLIKSSPFRRRRGIV